MIDLSVVILNWNVRDLLDRCLASIRSESLLDRDHRRRQCVHDDSVAMVRDKYPQVKLIANSINRGFTGGNNQGIAASHGSLCDGAESRYGRSWATRSIA